MPVPTIDPESSVLSYKQWETWEHTFSATNVPYGWSIASGSFPTGMTFEPSIDVTGEDADDLIDAVAHGLADGTLVQFGSLSGGSGLATTTRYYVINSAADTFQLSLTEGGAAVSFGSNITAGTIIRPGFVTGAATVPGISNVRLIATNGTGDSAEVLFTIGIEPAAATPDSNTDLVWDLSTGHVIAQTSSLLNLTPAAEGEPVILVKEGDDWIGRLRIIKGGTVLDLGMSANDLQLVLKEFEPESEIVVSSESVEQGTGTGTSYLVYASFTGALLASSLSNYEGDAGTAYDGLAEFEITYPNPESIGPAELVKSSRTFRIRVERDIADN